jgi:hypothetical protein
MGLTRGLLPTMTGILFPVIDILVRQKASPDSIVNACQASRPAIAQIVAEGA